VRGIEKSGEPRRVERLIRGGISLALLNPAKGAEIGKLSPVALLCAPESLEIDSPLLFVCPLSSRSEPRYTPRHVALPPRLTRVAWYRVIRWIRLRRC
jgi:mRNA-degrading endonuclease toxin of MazEF toxin-antitoxin module